MLDGWMGKCDYQTIINEWQRLTGSHQKDSFKGIARWKKEKIDIRDRMGYSNAKD